MRYEVYFPDHNPSQLVPGHTGVLGGPHVVVGDVHVRVAHAAEFTSKVTSSSPSTFLSMLILWNLASLADLASPNVVYMTAEAGAKWADIQQLSVSML